MKWKHLKKEINWEKVDASIISSDESAISSERFKTAKQMVTDAAEYFLPLDLQWFSIEAIEKEFEKEYFGGIVKDRGFIDLVLRIKPTAGKPYSEYAGETILIDWKSTSGELNTTWRNYYIESWQWKRYSAAMGNKLFEYRGVSSKNTWDGTRFVSACAPLILSVPENNLANVIYDIGSRASMKKGLLEQDVYPRNMPNACFKYNETCPFFDDCANFTMPKEILPIEILQTKTSYSSDELFSLCPEKFRRMKLLNEKSDDFDSASGLGTLVHRGLAEIYTQFKD